MRFVPAALFIALLLATPAAAEEICLECHEVDGEAFEASVHGGMGCSGCHMAAEEHDPGTPEHMAYPECGVCHDDVTAAYHASIHGQSHDAGMEEAPACATCHGKAHAMVLRDDPASPVHPDALAETCGSCHANPEVVDKLGITLRPLEAYEASVHARMAADGGAGPNCNDCHTSHDVFPARDPRSTVFHQRVPETCSGCHEEIAAAYRVSVHGKAAAKGIRESPVCTDCHGEHRILSPSERGSPVFATNVPRMTCGRCHGDLRVTEKYGMAADRIGSFEDSYHGLAGRSGVLTVANCSSCHGVHDILPSSDPAAHTHADNLAETCGQCHAGAGASFGIGEIHVDPTEREHAAVYWIRSIYLWLIVMTIGGMLLHNGADWLRKTIRPLEPPPPVPPGTQVRMPVGFRIAHAMMAISFIVLLHSGFALKYPEAWWARPFLVWEEELGLRGWVHRSAAILMIASMVFHLMHLILSRPARRRIFLMRPGVDDLIELRDRVLYFLGRRKGPPHTKPFGYAEKMEYLALVWGAILMTLTGLALWLDGPMLRWLPTWVIDAATAIHFYEAILAGLAILVWHLYFVIFDPAVYPMDKAWLTGQSHPARVHEREVFPGEAPSGDSRPSTGRLTEVARVG